jgi:heteromeric Ino2p/Ino4p transcription factor
MTSSPSSSKDTPTNSAAAKVRLTDQEKKNNHIASEQKRRQAIREGFDRLADIVPGMKGQGRSENLVLQNTIDYLKSQIVEYEELLAIAKEKGVSVEDLIIQDINHGLKDEDGEERSSEGK